MTNLAPRFIPDPFSADKRIATCFSRDRIMFEIQMKGHIIHK